MTIQEIEDYTNTTIIWPSCWTRDWVSHIQWTDTSSRSWSELCNNWLPTDVFYTFEWWRDRQCFIWTQVDQCYSQEDNNLSPLCNDQFHWQQLTWLSINDNLCSVWNITNYLEFTDVWRTRDCTLTWSIQEDICTAWLFWSSVPFTWLINWLYDNNSTTWQITSDVITSNWFFSIVYDTIKVYFNFNYQPDSIFNIAFPRIDQNDLWTVDIPINLAWATSRFSKTCSWWNCTITFPWSLPTVTYKNTPIRAFFNSFIPVLAWFFYVSAQLMMIFFFILYPISWILLKLKSFQHYMFLTWSADDWLLTLPFKIAYTTAIIWLFTTIVWIYLVLYADLHSQVKQILWILMNEILLNFLYFDWISMFAVVNSITIWFQWIVLSYLAYLLVKLFWRLI